MPRNDIVTSQWLLLKILERPGCATIEELLGSLPEDYACTSRTIRRDLQALEGRLLIYTNHVDGCVRWRRLEEFYRLPALQFSATELMALIFTPDLTKALEIAQQE
jgi:predicted DNA-binding transcriptional regulator YafY